jgi:hypothetical protein
MLSACADPPQYKSAAEFEAVVQSWRLTGKPKNEVVAILTKHRFTCKDDYCHLEAGGFPCMQRQKIFVVSDDAGIVTKTPVWKMQDGRLPLVCL